MKKTFFTKSKPEILNPPKECFEKYFLGSISLLLGIFCGIVLSFVLSIEESFVLKPEIFIVSFVGFVFFSVLLSRRCKE